MATEKIDISLYNDEIKIQFYPNSHQYKKDWVNLLSVSAICWVVDKSQALVYWATNLARDYLLEKMQIDTISEQDVIDACLQHKVKKEEAADIWSQAHEWVENYIKSNTISLPSDPRVANAVNWFLEWTKWKDIKREHSEIFTYSRKYNYVGIIDCIATIDWKRYLIDFKTSNSIYLLTYWMQTSAYLKAYEEQTGEQLDWIIIVKFAKEEIDKKWNAIPLFETQAIIDIDWFYEAFISAKVLKEYVKKYDTYTKY